VTAGWRSEARERIADRDKPLAPDEGIASAQAEWEGDLYAIAVRALDALDAVMALTTTDPMAVYDDGDPAWGDGYDRGYAAAMERVVRAIEGEQ